jgi:hypothetical protein
MRSEPGGQRLLEVSAVVVGVMPEVGDQPGDEAGDCGFEAKFVQDGVPVQV